MIEYDVHNWKSHLLDIKGSMVKEIFGRVMFLVAWSAAVVIFNRHVYSVAIPLDGHGLIGVALGLLLVFRTNSSYDRFWEGRKQWGSIVNESRNLARAAVVWVKNDPQLAETIVRWTIVFSWSSMHQLRGTRDLASAVIGLPAEEVKEVSTAAHPPTAVARRISSAIDTARRRGLISYYLQVALDQNVQLLVDCVGACERIHKTPLPFAYVVHLRRAVLAYCFTLPFALLEKFGWGALPATLLISYVLLGIEEIGVEIEDPFGEDDNDLPLEGICQAISGNLEEAIGELHRQAHAEQLATDAP